MSKTETVIASEPKTDPKLRLKARNGTLTSEEQKEYAAQSDARYYYMKDRCKNAIQAHDSGSFWYGVLGFFIPLIGLTLGAAWSKFRPKDANTALIGSVIGIALQVFLILIGFLFADRIAALFFAGA